MTFTLGNRPTHARPVTDTIEDFQFLHDTGAGAQEAAARLGFPTTEALEKWLRRHHPGSGLYRRLAERDTPVHVEIESDRTVFYTRRRVTA